MTDQFTSTLVARAKKLRKNATPQENHLWYDFLKSYPVKFRRHEVSASELLHEQRFAGKLRIADGCGNVPCLPIHRFNLRETTIA